MPTATLPLRPRTAAEVLDASLQLYRAHFQPLAALGAVSVLPFAAIALTVGDAAAATLGAGELWWLATGVGLLWFVIVGGAMQVAASQAYLSGAPLPRHALRHALRRAPRIVGAVLVSYLLIALPTLLAAILAMLVTSVVVGALGAAGAPEGVVGVAGVVALLLALVAVGATYVYFVGRYLLAPGLVVLEDSDVGEAIRRSRQLTSDRAAWRLAGAIVVVGVVLLAMNLAVVLTAELVVPARVAAALGNILWMLSFPLVPVVATLLHYDQRIRREGFDVEFLARTE